MIGVQRLVLRPRLLVAATLACSVALVACQATDGSQSPKPRQVEPTGPDALPPSKVVGDCDQLEDQFRSESRKLAKSCERTEDCSLLWSEYNCYALRSASDDVSQLEAIDDAMAKQDCDPVECEPPPMHECRAGVCDWAL